MKIKSILYILVITLITACSASPKPISYEITPIKITMSNNISYAPLQIAKAEGYFTDYGLEVEFVSFNQSSEAVALLLAGTTDVYAGTVNAGFLNTVSQEPSIKAVADRGHIASNDTCTYQALLIRKDLFESGEVTGPEDFAGLELDARNSGIHGFLLSTYLQGTGIDLDDMTFTDIPDSVLVDTFRAKAIDGVISTDPDLTMVLNSGEAVILAETRYVLGSLQTGIIAFGKNLLVDNPEVGARFLAAYLRGVKQYNEGKTDRNLEILSEANGEPIETLKVSCWPAIREDGMVDFNGIQAYQQWGVESGEVENLVTEDQFWDPGFLEKAKELIDE